MKNKPDESRFFHSQFMRGGDNRIVNWLNKLLLCILFNPGDAGQPIGAEAVEKARDQLPVMAQEKGSLPQ